MCSVQCAIVQCAIVQLCNCAICILPCFHSISVDLWGSPSIQFQRCHSFFHLKIQSYIFMTWRRLTNFDLYKAFKLFEYINNMETERSCQLTASFCLQLKKSLLVTKTEIEKSSSLYWYKHRPLLQLKTSNKYFPSQFMI